MAPPQDPQSLRVDERSLRRVLSFLVERGRDSVGLTRDDFVLHASDDPAFQKPLLDEILRRLEDKHLAEVDRYGNEFLARPTKDAPGYLRQTSAGGETVPPKERPTEAVSRLASRPPPTRDSASTNPAGGETRSGGTFLPPLMAPSPPPSAGPTSPSPSAGGEVRSSPVSLKARELARELEERTHALQRQEEELQKKENQLAARETELIARERQLQERGRALDQREEELGKREASLAELVQRTKVSAANLAARQRELDDREMELENLTAELGMQARVLEDLEQSLRATQDGIRLSHTGIRKILKSQPSKGTSRAGAAPRKGEGSDEG
jgi:hypothetical protein